MPPDVVRAWLAAAAAAAAVLVGCAAAPPEAPWPEQQVSLDEMQSTCPWVAPIPLPAVDWVRDRSRNSTVLLEAHVGAHGL